MIVGGEVSVSVQELYNFFGSYLFYTKILIKDVDGEIYYDLIDQKTHDIVCMDGETCVILDITDDYVLLEELDEKTKFKLSLEEFNFVFSA